MSEEITREEATEKLESIFRSNLEGEELDKLIDSIPQRLDKFEGKWPKLISWAEEKFGAADAEGDSDAEEPTGEAEEAEADPTPSTEEITREEATEKLESIFRSNLEGEELDKLIDSIPQRLDKFEGKWPKLISWAEEKFGAADAEGDSDAEEPTGEAEEAEAEPEPEKKKRRGFFSAFGKSKEEPEAEAETEDSEAEEPTGEAEEAEAEPEPEKKKRRGFFSAFGKSKEEPEAEAETEDSEAEEPTGEAEEDSEAEEPTGEAEEDSDEDWIVLKQSLISDPEKSETWKALADYFASRGNNGRSEACNDAADALS